MRRCKGKLSGCTKDDAFRSSGQYIWTLIDPLVDYLVTLLIHSPSKLLTKNRKRKKNTAFDVSSSPRLPPHPCHQTTTSTRQGGRGDYQDCRRCFHPALSNIPQSQTSSICDFGALSFATVERKVTAYFGFADYSHDMIHRPLQLPPTHRPHPSYPPSTAVLTSPLMQVLHCGHVRRGCRPRNSLLKTIGCNDILTSHAQAAHSSRKDAAYNTIPTDLMDTKYYRPFSARR